MTITQSQPIITRILTHYGLRATRVLPAQTGYRNHAYPIQLEGGRTANLILYKSEPGILAKIRAANAVADYLATQGFPARRTLDPRIITLRTATKVKYSALYHYLPGHTIPWDGYTMKHLKLLGLALGRMHQALRHLARPSTTPDVATEYAVIVRRMQAYFDQPGVQHAMASKLGLTLDPSAFGRLDHLLRHCTTLPGQHILHMDFVRSNILFGPTTEHSSNPFQLGSIAIAGILDFEKTAYGHPAFDLARTLAFLLVDCKYKPEAKIRKYFLHSGYAKRGGGAPAPTALLEPLVDLFLIHDFYKFLRHNPYESLPQNEHFVRTVAPLKERNYL